MKRIGFFSSLTLVLVLIISMYAIKTSKKDPLVDLPQSKQVDEIKVSIIKIINNGTQSEICTTKIIDNIEQIETIITKIQEYSNNWQYEQFSPPWTGIAGRITPVRISFYKNKEIKKVLGIGYSQAIGYFLQQSPGPGRYLSFREFEELMSLINVNKEVVDGRNIPAFCN